ncbi:sensor histidine kinase [Planomonospora parontospora]|uniref:sensor histidine kinase n=1 Tax=Planomonospora parontospora TaxID=58119 RepID=UPI00166F8F0C|nr:ATP-binding protein [Planomonospora parontospora]GGL31318.1 histidine kinase [Planomonospora parontospora subsp. antibiotica]GII16592.1 histidine kinase [Planomonospora parontospora subsp. antibiotica]
MTAEEKAAPSPVRARAGRWSAQGWVNVVLLAMAFLLAGSAVTGATALRNTAQVSNRLVDQISPARVESERLKTALLNQESGVRGFVLTGREEFLEPYTDGLEAERESVGEIRRLIRQGRPLRELDEVERLIGLWRTRHAEPMIERIRDEGAEQVSTAQVEASRQSFETVRAALDAQNAAWTRSRDDARANLGDARLLRDAAFLGILTVLLFAIIAVAVLLRVVVFRPLDRLSAASRRVTGGDFEHHVDTGGPADIAALSRDMEAMRERIVAELEESRRARQLLEEQTTELRRSNAELEQFAYVASHDLQEPLRKVASFTQMLEQRYGEQLDDRARQYITFAVDGAKRMQVLINELLTFSRVGRITREPVTFALEETIASALRNLTAAVEESGGEIELGPLPEVTGDRSQFVMLWQNLLGNALKFRHPDRAPVVRVESRREDGEWLITVTDNGIGIDARFADKIFVIFQRLHNRDAYEGTGIGLAICRKIVEYHRGRIWLDTGYTGGTRFVIALPATGEEPEPGPSGSGEASAERQDPPAAEPAGDRAAARADS